jgi:hypothetical protein
MFCATRRRRNLLLRSSILAALGALGSGCDTTVTVFGDGGGGSGGGNGGAGPSGPGPAGPGPTSGPGGGSAGCSDAKPILQPDGTESGYARCEDGTVHRYAALRCSTEVHAPACQGDETTVVCRVDEECTDAPFGRCIHRESSGKGGDTSTYCGCVYPCAGDDDCDPTQACVCEGVMDDGKAWSSCATASCRENAACPSNECGVSAHDDGCGITVGLGCRAPGDACRLDEACEDERAACVLPWGTDPWTCMTPDCAIGRPLLVAEGARTAPPARRDDWSDGELPTPRSVDGATAAALASHWQRVAALEHASVASFARFSLQLMALGAPPALLLDAQRAAMDEVAHARVAYALASAYAGQPVGPGPLDLTGVGVAVDRRAAMLELVAEACVGETLGAAEARELASAVADPCLARVHARIADEEQRHAELAWRALAWMLEDASADDRAAVRAAFATAAADARRHTPADPEVIAPEHGLLSGRELALARNQAIDDVVLPCAARLLA